MPVSLAKSPRYVKFVRARNKALEVFHLKTQLKISSAIQLAILSIKDMVALRYSDIMMHGIYSPTGKDRIARIEMELRRTFGAIIPQICHEITSLRRITYALTYASESEAIGQSVGEKTNYSLTRDKINKVLMSDAFLGGSIEGRVQYVVNKLIRKILSSIELSAITEKPHGEAMDAVARVLPKIRRVSTDQRNIGATPIKEADKPEDESPDMSTGYIDDQTWEEIVDTYKSEQVPSWRGPDTSFTTTKGGGDSTEIFAWDLEQEVTQDFVYQVRLGQVDAAKENGINDYVWVAIVDNRTDECCTWRDGLTTAEIEQKLKSERSDDECQALVPPAHFNCRCVLAPMVDEMPERPESNEKEFDAWLNS